MSGGNQTRDAKMSVVARRLLHTRTSAIAALSAGDCKHRVSGAWTVQAVVPQIDHRVGERLYRIVGKVHIRELKNTSCPRSFILRVRVVIAFRCPGRSTQHCGE
jgi:hypothetical protein